MMTMKVAAPESRKRQNLLRGWGERGVTRDLKSFVSTLQLVNEHED